MLQIPGILHRWLFQTQIQWLLANGHSGGGIGGAVFCCVTEKKVYVLWQLISVPFSAAAWPKSK